MPARSGNLPPFADSPSASQTGTYILRSLRRPIVWVILVGMVIAWWGVTGITTALRKMDSIKEERRHVAVYSTDGHGGFLPIVNELCGPQAHAWENCFPRYTHKKRVSKCKRKIKELEDCTHSAQEAEKACRHSDPTLNDGEVIKCARRLVNKNSH